MTKQTKTRKPGATPANFLKCIIRVVDCNIADLNEHASVAIEMGKKLRIPDSLHTDPFETREGYQRLLRLALQERCESSSSQNARDCLANFRKAIPGV